MTGPHLHTIYPHGSTNELPYVTMGSGSLAAMSVFEMGSVFYDEQILFVGYEDFVILTIFVIKYRQSRRTSFSAGRKTWREEKRSS